MTEETEDKGLDPKEILLAICIPSGTMWDAEFGNCLASMTAATIQAGVSFIILNHRSCYVSNNRNTLVRDALSRGATHILFLDCDMTFPRETALRLIAHNEPIVAATYCKRVPPYHVLGDFIPGSVKPGFEGVLPVKSYLPTGVMMIKREVFEKLPTPWFRLYYDPEKCDAENTYGLVGEDVDFCVTAGNAGYQVLMDVGLTYHIGHCSQQIIRISREPASPDDVGTPV